MIALLAFYHYTACWQKTNRPKASVKYVAKGLHWKPDKVRAIKSALRELNLIEDVRVVDPRSRKVKGWYVRLRFFQPTSADFTYEKPPSPQNQRVDSGVTNALRADTENALRSSKQSKMDADHSQAARSLSFFELSNYSEEEREVIEQYHHILCANDRSWRKVNKYTESVCEVIEFFTYEAFEDVEAFFAKALAASQCGCEEEDCEYCSAISVPPRGQSRTLVNLAWKNY
jgi:hypothetical protein